MGLFRRSVIMTTTGVLVWLLVQALSQHEPYYRFPTFVERLDVISRAQLTKSNSTRATQWFTDVSHSPPGLSSLNDLINLTQTSTTSAGKDLPNQPVIHPTWFKSTICTGQDTTCWDHCLPFRGERDRRICSGATKYDLMVPTLGHRKHCHTSVLHMILDDFIEVTKQDADTARTRPLLTYGTLLGAFRNSSLIPWTHDVDLAYFKKYWTPSVQSKLVTELRRKGYTLFHQDIWRVCAHAQHPLAALLSNEMGNFSNAKRVYGGDIPYLDLYSLKEEARLFRHATVVNPLNRATLLPVRKLRLLGRDYEAIHAPEIFFRQVGYGDYTLERIDPHK